MTKKIIVYDFDKTLTTHDTLFGFFRHAGKKNLKHYAKLPIYMGWMVLSKFGLVGNTQLKERGVALFLKGLSKESIQNFAKSYKKKILFNEIYHKLNFDKNTRYFIISASFEDYLKPLFPEEVCVIGSKLTYVKMAVNALELNCYKEVKKEVLKELGINKIDLFYTDSYSDLTLAQIAEKIIIVDKNRQIECNSINEFKRHFGR